MQSFVAACHRADAEQRPALCRPSHGELFAAPAEPHYITWEQDFAGMNNVRYQVRLLADTSVTWRRIHPDNTLGCSDGLSGCVGG